MIAAIVLAAGGSTRMGRPKMLLPAGSGTVLSAAVEPLLEAGLERVVTVLGDRAEAVRAGANLPESTRLSVVVNDAWREGMSSTLRRGLRECIDADAVLIVLGDQPGMSSERVRRILKAFGPDVPLVAAVHGDVPVHPMLFSRELFPELLALSGDVGAREVLRRHWREAVLVEAEPLPDLDTEEDYRRFRESG